MYPLQSWGSLTKGNKIRGGGLMLAFSGGQNRAGLLRKPDILGGPQPQAPGQIPKWLPHPRLLGAPAEGKSVV